MAGTDIEEQIGLAPSAHVLMSAVSSTRPTQVHEQYFSTTRWKTKTPVFRQCLHGRDAPHLTAAYHYSESWPQVIKQARAGRVGECSTAGNWSTGRP